MRSSFKHKFVSDHMLLYLYTCMLKCQQSCTLCRLKCQKFGNFPSVYHFPGNNYTWTIRIFYHPGSISTHKLRHTRNSKLFDASVPKSQECLQTNFENISSGTGDIPIFAYFLYKCRPTHRLTHIQAFQKYLKLVYKHQGNWNKVKIFHPELEINL